jgi:hypothetical protein
MRLTELANEECLSGIGCPFSVGDVVLLVHIESKLLGSLEEAVSLGKHRSGLASGKLTLLNFSKPPSVSLMFLIHLEALLYRSLRASRKGSSHGSRPMTPANAKVSFFTSSPASQAHGNLPVPSMVESSNLRRLGFSLVTAIVSAMAYIYVLTR